MEEYLKKIVDELAMIRQAEWITAAATLIQAQVAVGHTGSARRTLDALVGKIEEMSWT